MRRDRFLIFILCGISLLAITAVVSVLVRTQHLDYTDDSSPAGIVQNYVLALQRDDLEMAYSYLADLDHKPSLLEFQSLISTTHGRSQTAGIRIGETHVIGDDATLELVVLNLRSGSFLIDELSQRDDVAVLVRQDSQWRISQMPFEFWMHNWYREARGPVPLSPPN